MVGVQKFLMQTFRFCLSQYLWRCLVVAPWVQVALVLARLARLEWLEPTFRCCWDCAAGDDKILIFMNRLADFNATTLAVSVLVWSLVLFAAVKRSPPITTWHNFGIYAGGWLAWSGSLCFFGNGLIGW